MNIIKSNLISAQYDELWDDVSTVVMDAAPRPVLILVNSYDPANAEGQQLLKMLEAAKLSPEQYNIIEIKDGRQVAWHKLREQLDPAIIFLIGILPSQLGISSLFRLNQPNRFNDRVWLPTVSLNELEQNKALKTQLWNEGMKVVFDPSQPALKGR